MKTLSMKTYTFNVVLQDGVIIQVHIMGVNEEMAKQYVMNLIGNNVLKIY